MPVIPIYTHLFPFFFFLFTAFFCAKRVGYDHGPQVPDPRAPEWLPYVEGFEVWWDKIWEAQKGKGDKHSTMTCEHGPPNYQWALPYTRQPIADIWEVNNWVQQRETKRFAEKFGS